MPRDPFYTFMIVLVVVSGIVTAVGVVANAWERRGWADSQARVAETYACGCDVEDDDPEESNGEEA